MLAGAFILWIKLFQIFIRVNFVMLASLRISLLSLLDNPTEKELSDASNILKWDDAHNWDELDKMHDILWNEINCKDEWSSVTINKRTLFSATSLIKAHRFIENSLLNFVNYFCSVS